MNSGPTLAINRVQGFDGRDHLKATREIEPHSSCNKLPARQREIGFADGWAARHHWSISYQENCRDSSPPCPLCPKEDVLSLSRNVLFVPGQIPFVWVPLVKERTITGGLVPKCLLSLLANRETTSGTWKSCIPLRGERKWASFFAARASFPLTSVPSDERPTSMIHDVRNNTPAYCAIRTNRLWWIEMKGWLRMSKSVEQVVTITEVVLVEVVWWQRQRSSSTQQQQQFTDHAATRQA